MEDPMTMTEEIHPEIHEDEDVLPSRTILVTLVSTVALGGLLCAVAYGLLLFSELELRSQREFPERELPPPRERASVRAEPFEVPRPRPSLLEEQGEGLRRYRWIDRNAGVVAVPIDVAIGLVVAEGAR
ncbi:MAG TPA: hypothetical protein VH877_17155 [Polyangia bacterium]|jgi:hypothetical protein|nr:hypothetical protein [Polyangia bacterium]